MAVFRERRACFVGMDLVREFKQGVPAFVKIDHGANCVSRTSQTGKTLESKLLWGRVSGAKKGWEVSPVGVTFKGKKVR